MASIRTDFFPTSNIAPEVMFAWPYIFKARTVDSDGKPVENPRREVDLLFRKQHPDPRMCPIYQRLQAMIVDLSMKAFNCQYPPNSNWPIKDGDAPRQDGTHDEKDAYKRGHWVIKASTYNETVLVADANNNAITMEVVNGEKTLKGGDFGIASINLYSYDNRTKGVNFGLEALKVTRKGEAVANPGAGRALSEVFGAPTGAPVFGAPMGAPMGAPTGAPAFGGAPQGYPALGAPQGYPATAPQGYPAPAPQAPAFGGAPQGYPAPAPQAPQGYPAPAPQAPQGYPAPAPQGFPPPAHGAPQAAPFGTPGPAAPSFAPAAPYAGAPSTSGGYPMQPPANAASAPFPSSPAPQGYGAPQGYPAPAPQQSYGAGPMMPPIGGR